MDDIIEFISNIIAAFMAVGLFVTLFVGLIKLIIWIWTI